MRQPCTRNAIGIAVILCGWLHPQAALARQTAAAARFYSEIFVKAERGPEPRRHTPSATTLLTRESIELLPVFTLADVLDHMPGFRVLTNGIGSAAPIVAARGFFGGGETDPVQLLGDGVPLSAGESGLAAWTKLRAADIERVETLRAVRSTATGPMEVSSRCSRECQTAVRYAWTLRLDRSTRPASTSRPADPSGRWRCAPVER